jgi:SagB-type dehydrogenase family enzyme
MPSNPFPKNKEDDPLIVHYPIVNTLKLDEPGYYKPVNFWDVLRNRSSGRDFRKLSLEEISAVLWASSKVKNLAVQENGYILTHRPASSAGARHPIDLVVTSSTLNCNEFHYYNPFDHTLNKLDLVNFSIDAFLHHIASVISLGEGTIIWFICHPQRTSAKYENFQSLVWRDAGVLIHSIQIACCGLSLNSCPVGSLGEPFISKGFSDVGDIFGVGGILIG